jgi:peptide/nickel transport system substrate-binding protein
VLLTAHDDYWGDGPYVDDVQFRVIPDEASLHAGMQAGEFHIGVMTDPAVVPQGNQDELTVERTPALAYRALMLNNTVEPLDDQSVRQAIACAIDREQLVESATFGEGASTGPFTAASFAGDPYDGLPCDGPDIDLARDLLEDAGVGDGFELETIVITGEYGTAIAEAQNLQAQLAEINVDLDLVQLETNVYVERWLDTDFDAAVALNGGRPDPHQMYARYFTSTGNLNDVATYSSDTLDTLFADGLAETDEDARAAIYAEISRELLDASPWAWLFTGYEYRVLQPDVDGFIPTPTGSLKTLRSVRLG